MTILTTKRLTIRPVHDEDCEDLHRIYSDPQAMRYWSRLPHTTMAETMTSIEYLKAQNTDTSFGRVIDFQGRAIGRISLWRVREIGFILHPDYWGQGFAREALDAVIAHGFHAMGLNAITADVDPRNDACLALLQKIGFVETGRAERTFLLGEEWCDSIYLSLSKAQFTSEA